MSLTVSVVVVTYRRPEHVRTCLTHLAALHTAPIGVIVVDGSPDDRTTRIVREEFPDVVYLRNELGRGTTAESRQIGFAATTGDIVAFVDDDAFAEPDWLDELLVPYVDARVAGVGGRASNGIEGEESIGVGEIGLLLPDGRLTGNFAADPGRTVAVDHMLGANMSFRRSAIERIGGIHGNYPGTCLCEESDIALRVRRDGGELVYTPSALVHHVAAPYGIGGKRFDRRWLYYSRRNHVVMLARVYGWSHPLLRRYVATAIRDQRQYARLLATRLAGRDTDDHRVAVRAVLAAGAPLSRSAAELGGLLAGFPSAMIARRQDLLALRQRDRSSGSHDPRVR